MMQSPLINSDNVTLLRTLSTRELASVYSSTYGIETADEFTGSDTVSLYSCNLTGLRFFGPPEVAGSERLYQQLQKISWYYTPDKWEHQTARKELARYANCKRVLEIGCGEGSFVKSLREKGLEAQGIEINSTAVQNARQLGLPVELLDLKDAAEQYPESFDAVCCFQVLEHVPNPGEFIRWSLRLLKPGGRFIVCVPNADSYLKYYFEPLDMPPHHMSRWNRVTFRALQKHFAVRVEKFINEPLADYHVEKYLSGYCGHFRRSSPPTKLLWSPSIVKVYRRLLNAGFRRFVPGQCLYAQFVKTVGHSQ